MKTNYSKSPPDAVSHELAQKLLDLGITRPLRRGDWVAEAVWETIGIVLEVMPDSILVHFERSQTPTRELSSTLIWLPRIQDMHDILGQVERVDDLAKTAIYTGKWKLLPSQVR